MEQQKQGDQFECSTLSNLVSNYADPTRYKGCGNKLHDKAAYFCVHTVQSFHKVSGADADETLIFQKD